VGDHVLDRGTEALVGVGHPPAHVLDDDTLESARIEFGRGRLGVHHAGGVRRRLPDVFDQFEPRPVRELVFRDDAIDVVFVDVALGVRHGGAVDRREPCRVEGRRRPRFVGRVRTEYTNSSHDNRTALLTRACTHRRGRYTCNYYLTGLKKYQI
jgi:hypothetical protein